MAGFLYYLPKRRGALDGDLAELGLLDVLACPRAFGEAPKGPDDGAGCMIARSPASRGTVPELAYRPEDQEWRECGGGKWWLGWYRQSPPRPMDLERSRSELMGYRVKLGDGDSWLVPVARSFPEGCPLPKSLVLGSDGESVTEQLLGEYVEFSKRAERLWGWFCADNGLAELAPGDHGERPDYAWRLGTVAMALGLVYHVSRWEVGMTGLVTSDNIREVERAIFDWPEAEALVAAAKKKGLVAADGGTGISGAEGG